ncbi:MAG: type II/IV secretion system protein [Candidatus Pacebacteria bacterium]|nr:type II/IV secretion system protein [Candidatus Paceibacterota bacterium]
MTIQEKQDQLEQEISLGKDISIINLIDYLIEQAHKHRASDIHIDPNSHNIRIRFRIDGVLQDAFEFPKKIHNEIISRIKVLSKLRSDEHQATQDGRFRYTLPDAGEFIDMRISIVPTYHGENVVMRLLTENQEHHDLESLGFSENDIKKITNALNKTSGMILSTGPTGSGKTTTLYTLIKMLNSAEVSIVTIEDPIEYAINGVEQIQVNNQKGLTFGSGLRSILRQDPNIIMVGEIRDAETASIAVNTALTGHLLLSTLHTNDAATTLPRLLDMGIEEYLVASTVNIAIGQRLLRKICPNCKEKQKMTETIRKSFTNTTFYPFLQKMTEFYVGKGCEKCSGSGYRGRTCINEVLVADESIREAILRKAPSSEIKNLAISHGMTTMLEDGFQKVKTGITTLEEILRVIHE